MGAADLQNARQKRPWKLDRVESGNDRVSFGSVNKEGRRVEQGR